MLSPQPEDSFHVGSKQIIQFTQNKGRIEPAILLSSP